MSPSSDFQIRQILPTVVARARPQIASVRGGRRPRTGLVWGPDQILTRARGLDPGDEVRVRTAEDREHTGEVIGRDASSDLALVRVVGLDVEPLAVRDNSPVLGEPLVAVFSQWGTVRVAFGVVGALGDGFHTPSGTRVDAWIELDRDLARGATGAAVVDFDGRLVGVATRGVVRGSTLVLPAASIRRVTDQLEHAPTLARGYVGLAAHSAQLSEPMAQDLGQARAVVVAAVQPDGPAEKAGVLVGDVIVAIDDQSVQSPLQLRHAVWERTGRALHTTLLRGGHKTELSIEPATRT